MGPTLWLGSLDEVHLFFNNASFFQGARCLYRNCYFKAPDDGPIFSKKQRRPYSSFTGKATPSPPRRRPPLPVIRQEPQPQQPAVVSTKSKDGRKRSTKLKEPPSTPTASPARRQPESTATTHTALSDAPRAFFDAGLTTGPLPPRAVKRRPTASTTASSNAPYLEEFTLSCPPSSLIASRIISLAAARAVVPLPPAANVQLGEKKDRATEAGSSTADGGTDATGTPQSSSKKQTKGKGKNKRSARANANNVHHRDNYVPSRLPAAAASQPANNGQVSDGLSTELSTAFQAGRDEYLCAFCEYELFFGEESLFAKCIRRRKRVLKVRKRAQERARKGVGGKTADEGKENNSKPYVPGDPNSVPYGVPTGSTAEGGRLKPTSAPPPPPPPPPSSSSSSSTTQIPVNTNSRQNNRRPAAL
jgi:hypothetical protein